MIEGFVPPGLKGAITTNNETNVSGNMLIDGRDFDLNGKRIKGQGIYGVWTTNTFTKDNGSLIGGFANNKDYPPTKNINQNIIKQNQSWPLGYSHTPDGVMGGYDYGFSEGTLKSLAISGKEGGQYVTNPSNLKFPIAGVTYVELASGSKWSANLSGSGILIVHNSNRNAFLDRIKGKFRGLIISDHVDQFHANLLGGLIGLASDNTFGPAIGLGSGKILYSSEAIKLVTKNIGKGRIVGGKYRLAIDYWLEN